MDDDIKDNEEEIDLSGDASVDHDEEDEEVESIDKMADEEEEEEDEEPYDDVNPM